MMRGPGSGWCKMKSPADSASVAGHIPESPSSSSARQRLRPSARVPPFPPHPGPLLRGARPAGVHGVGRAAVGPRLRPRLRPAPARGAAGVARGGRPSLPGSFAGEAGLAAPSSVEARGPGARPAVASPCTVAADIRAQSAPSRAAWPLGTAPERLGARRGVRAEAWGWGPVFAPAKRIPSVPLREAASGSPGRLCLVLLRQLLPRPPARGRTPGSAPAAPPAAPVATGTEAPAEGVRARGEAPRSAGPWRPGTPGPWPWDVRAAEGQTPQGRCPRLPRAAPAQLTGGEGGAAAETRGGHAGGRLPFHLHKPLLV